jgi:hypothetical protein
VLATLNQIWRFENVLASDQVLNYADRHYVPRVAHTTGNLDVHDIGVTADGVIVFVQHAVFVPRRVERRAFISADLATFVHLQACR